MDIQLQLFHTPVTPVVMYGEEAWEIEDYTVIEQLHLKFCKYILSLNKCTYTNMVYTAIYTVKQLRYRLVYVLSVELLLNTGVD